jgi:hypothetical protein
VHGRRSKLNQGGRRKKSGTGHILKNALVNGVEHSSGYGAGSKTFLIWTVDPEHTAFRLWIFSTQMVADIFLALFSGAI